MKKYLFSFIPVNPVFIFLSTATLYSDIVFANADHDDDTAYYYSESGRLLYRDVHASQAASYVIKTTKSITEIFPDVPRDDSSMELSDSYETAAVNGIARDVARKVKRLIRHGAVHDPLVIDNIVQVLDKRTIRRMYDNIVSRCLTSTDHNIEHGGVVLPDGTVTCISGELSDPRWFQGATLAIKQKAMIYYHSHPGGTVEQPRNAEPMYVSNPNRFQYSQTVYTQVTSYVQGPSLQDQQSVGEGMGYVFGMKAGVEMIYIYDKAGVKATLPIAFVKNIYKTNGKKAKKTDTYYAGIQKPLPKIF